MSKACEVDPILVKLKLKSKGIKVDDETKTITVPSGSLVGLKIWSKIDFLCNAMKYIWKKG